MKNHIISEAQLTTNELAIFNKLYNQYKENKQKFVKDYGKDASKVMRGRAIKLAKNMADKENKQKIREIIKLSLSQGIKEEINTDEFLKNRQPILEVTKNDFKTKIKTLVKSIYSTKKDTKIDLDSTSTVSLDITRFPALQKFPTLLDTVIKLLTDQYELFIKDVEWVAPRPTTFRIVLANDQVFYLIYTDRTWIGKVEGKKYYLLNISEEQNCIESIARILSYGAKANTEITPPKEEKVETPETPETSGEEEPA